MKLSVWKNNQIFQEAQFELNSSNELVISIGRSSHCHIVIDDQRISRVLCEIVVRPELAVLNVISEENEIFLRGNKVSHQSLSDEDIFEFHDYRITFQGFGNANSAGDIISSPLESSRSKSTENFNHYTDTSIEGIQASTDNVPRPQNVTETNTGKDDYTEILPSDEMSAIVKQEVLNDQESEKLDEQPTVVEMSIDKSQVEHTQLKEADELSTFGDFVSDSEYDEPAENSIVESTEGFDFTSNQLPVGSDGEGTVQINNFIEGYLVPSGLGVYIDEFVISQSKVVIGSSSKSDLEIGNESLAPQAFLVARKGASFSVKCLEQDFIEINGKRVKETILNSGDRFSVGSVDFQFRIRSRFVEEEQDHLLPIEEAQADTEILNYEARADNQSAGEAEQKPKGFKRFFNFKKDQSKKSKKTLIYGGVLILLILTLFDEETAQDEVISDSDGAKKSSEFKSTNNKPKAGNANSNEENNIASKNLTAEQLEAANTHYLVAKKLIDEREFEEAINELDEVRVIDPNYKQTAQLYSLAKDGLQELELERKRRAQIKSLTERKQKIAELVEKVRSAIKDKSLELANSYLGQVAEIDPESPDIIPLKLEIESLQEADRKRKEEQRVAKERRLKLMKALAPVREKFTDKKWYEASKGAEEFLRGDNIDEDLFREAKKILVDSKKNIANLIGPKIEEAKRLHSGQDFKNAYEKYLSVLKIDPTNDEAFIKTTEIREGLDRKAKTLFQSALVSESINLYNDALDKYKQVLQVAPSDSEYYRKASRKIEELSFE